MDTAIHPDGTICPTGGCASRDHSYRMSDEAIAALEAQAQEWEW